MSETRKILVVGTHNAGKCREMREVLAGLPLDVRPLSDFPEVGPVEETGETFEANAATKAADYARATGQWCVADDSGLEVVALDGRPGIQSARWGGEQGNDRLNNARLLRELRGVPHERRQARYVCVAALASPDGRVLAAARGTCDGLIAESPRGTGGFGYDPLFLVPGLDRTMAELAAPEKHAISHRGRAFRALREKIERLLAF